MAQHNKIKSQAQYNHITSAQYLYSTSIILMTRCVLCTRVGSSAMKPIPLRWHMHTLVLWWCVVCCDDMLCVMICCDVVSVMRISDMLCLWCGWSDMLCLSFGYLICCDMICCDMICCDMLWCGSRLICCDMLWDVLWYAVICCTSNMHAMLTCVWCSTSLVWQRACRTSQF